MTCLHTISRSPASKLLQSCASLLKDGDAVLFIEDGVYHCLQFEPWPEIAAEIHVFSLREDMHARAVLDRNVSPAESVNLDRFVQLCCEYDKVVSWF